MHIEDYRNYCIAKPGVSEEFPFDNETLVFKVMGKMFALANIERFVSVNLKCDPELALMLRESYDGVKPGYHMNKKHWNTVMVDASIDDSTIYEWIDHSYDLVVKGLPKKLRSELSEW